MRHAQLYRGFEYRPRRQLFFGSSEGGGKRAEVERWSVAQREKEGRRMPTSSSRGCGRWSRAFVGRATRGGADVSRQIVNVVEVPDFVSGSIEGVFTLIVESSISQTWERPAGPYWCSSG